MTFRCINAQTVDILHAIAHSKSIALDKLNIFREGISTIGRVLVAIILIEIGHAEMLHVISRIIILSTFGNPCTIVVNDVIVSSRSPYVHQIVGR